VNELIGFVADPNVSIQESKALTCDIVRGRRSRGRRVVTSGPLLPEVDHRGGGRDLPEVGAGKTRGKHGVLSSHTRQSEES
jgi:formate dehydrogenase major subunit